VASERFSKDRRLRKRREFLAVQSGGEKVHTRHFLLLVRRTSNSCGRVGITVSKRVGNAVTRNRVKRLVREVARRTGALTVAGTEVVVIAKASAARADLQTVHADLVRGAGRIAT